MRRSGYSLASVLLVVTVAAVLMAAVAAGSPDFREAERRGLPGAFGTVGVVLGALVGTLTVYGRKRKIRWGIAGCAIGLICGGVAGLICALPRAAPAAGIGAIVVVAYAAVVRRFSRRGRRPWSRERRPS